MNRLTFGDGPSPFVAIKTLLKTAFDFGNGRERAVSAIKNNFYVDDYLDSFDTAEEAIEFGNQVKTILKDGDQHHQVDIKLTNRSFCLRFRKLVRV